jgi:ribosomal protein L21E
MTCARCSPRFALEHVLQWTRHGRPATMHPNYLAELRALASGQRLSLLPVGARARVVAPGQFSGRVGTVVKRGRTSYHIQVPEGVLRVVFAAAQPW